MIAGDTGRRAVSQCVAIVLDLMNGGRRLLCMSRAQTKLRAWLVAWLVLVIISVCGFCWYRWQYPYGRRPHDLRIMYCALNAYAMDHQGLFPSSTNGPEASLCLLFAEGYVLDLDLLSGWTVSEDQARSDLLGPRGHLTDDSCSWQYVPGLTWADDPDLAILWDRSELGHNGRRANGGGHDVLFLNGRIRFIPANEWVRFQEQQEELLSKRSDQQRKGRPFLVAMVELPNGHVTNEYHGPYTLSSASPNGQRTISGDHLDRESLIWYMAPHSEGSVAFTLSFSNLVSSPVTVVVVSNTALPNSIVFKMHERRR
jgi:hypothetical protein